MTEPLFHQWLAWGVIGIAVITFIALFFVSAPYGRHGRTGWGPTMPTRWAWIVMESPSVLVYLAIFAMGAHRTSAVPLALLVMWQAHYVNRTFVYPLKMRADGKRTPIAIAGMAIVFNLINSYLNARHISHFGTYDTSWLFDPRFLIGVGLFFAGREINIRSDAILVGLRKSSDAGYQIPHGGLFRWVSSPNYLGEIIEWLGWAIATWSLAGASFAVFTFANLAPRAVSNHRWYREKFKDYPASRKALIPFLW